MKIDKRVRKSKPSVSHVLKTISKAKKPYLILGSVIFISILVMSFVVLNLLFKTTKSLLTSAHQYVETVQIDHKSISKFQTINCWEHSKTLLNLRPWLEQPTDQIIKNLKSACLKDSTTKCESDNCKSNNSFI